MEKKELRHAWLIIAHGNVTVLKKQLRFLDSENADIFIHMDAKADNIDFEALRVVTKHSAVTFVPRIRISWGHFSLAESELILLREATAGCYDYYHLLSGVDVPLKSREYIESYFSRRNGTNYIHMQSPTLSREFSDRVKYYYPLQRLNIRNRALRTGLRRATILLERPFVNRCRGYGENFIWQKGSQWWSITHDFAVYLLSREDWIRKTFRSTFCSDEIFTQTVIMNSPFRSTLFTEEASDDHRSCLRYIDWTRGKPYCFRDSDTEELLHTGEDYLFARKFNYATDPRVVDTLFSYFGEDAL